MSAGDLLFLDKVAGLSQSCEGMSPKACRLTTQTLMSNLLVAQTERETHRCREREREKERKTYIAATIVLLALLRKVWLSDYIYSGSWHSASKLHGVVLQSSDGATF
eukprot:2441589-Amphidinium_carterae.1